MKAKNYLKMCVIEFFWFFTMIFLLSRLGYKNYSIFLYYTLLIRLGYIISDNIKFTNGIIIFLTGFLTIGIAETNFRIATRVMVSVTEEMMLSMFMAMFIIDFISFLICCINTYFLGNIPMYIKRIIQKK